MSKSLSVFFCILAWVPMTAFSDDIKWDPSSVVKADVDCDGAPDTARLGYVGKNRVRLSVTFAATKTVQSLDFGWGDSMAQDSLCGTEAVLTVEDLDYDLAEIFGEAPEGFKKSKTCKGLNVSGGECDSMHIYWDHQTKQIEWWRL